jgi:hypothetical protein
MAFRAGASGGSRRPHQDKSANSTSRFHTDAPGSSRSSPTPTTVDPLPEIAPHAHAGGATIA